MGKLNFNLWSTFKTIVVNTLKSKVVTLALTSFLGSAALGGFRAWLVQYIVTELYDVVAKPIILFSFRKVGYTYEVIKGEHILRRIENADEIDDWRDAIGDA